MIGCLPTRACKQPIIGLYFELGTILKFYIAGPVEVCGCGFLFGWVVVDSRLRRNDDTYLKLSSVGRFMMLVFGWAHRGSTRVFL